MSVPAMFSHGLVILATLATLGVGAMMWKADTAAEPPTTLEPLPPPPKVATPVTPALPKPRNLILITIDTLRADRLGTYGYAPAKSPTIDRLAATGVRFDQATVPFPRTTPAMASLFTGLWPHHHGSREVWEPMKQGVVLTEVLSAAGFETFGVVSNPACSHRQHFDRGFRELTLVTRKFGTEDGNVVTDEALRMVAMADPIKPLFLWVHYIDPHWSYNPPATFLDQPPAPKCREVMRRLAGPDLSTGEFLSNHFNVAKDAFDDCSALYDAEIAYVDGQLRRLIDGLMFHDRWDDSLVVFTSDHGENMGEDDYWFGHGPSVHDAALRVPLIVAGPTIPAGKVDDSVTRGEDVMPTVLGLLEIPEILHPAMDGRRFDWRWNPRIPLPDRNVDIAFAESGTPLRAIASTFLVTGNRAHYCINDERYSVCVHRRKPPKFFDRIADPRLETELTEIPEDAEQRLRVALQRWKPETARQRTARTTSFKLVEVPKIEGGYRRALYDLRTDPGETKDVSEEFPKELRRLTQLLARWIDDVPIYQARERSNEELEELRALGYIH